MKSPLGRFEMDVPPHYQDKLADLIRAEKPEIVVETGVYKGLGSEYILKAMDDNGVGHLYSIDPSPHKDYFAQPIFNSRFTLILEKSQNSLQGLLNGTGPWDMFIHDSDHDCECQSFEYEFAWDAVRPGGIIVTDDPFWGMPPHMTWDKFLAKHGVKNRNIMGNAQWIRRT